MAKDFCKKIDKTGLLIRSRKITVKKTNFKESCCYCEDHLTYPIPSTKEHVIPKSRGGNDSEYNMRICCWWCNNWRGNKNLDYWAIEIKELIDNNRTRVPYPTKKLHVILKNIDRLNKFIRFNYPKMVKYYGETAKISQESGS